MAKHELKTWPSSFQALIDKRKTYEIRKSDRDYKVGDILHLKEWVPAHEEPCDWTDATMAPSECFICHRWKSESLPGTYTFREAFFRVTYITSGGKFGLPPDVCVMSVTPMSVGE